jgi:hypothetical protein
MNHDAVRFVPPCYKGCSEYRAIYPPPFSGSFRIFYLLQSKPFFDNRTSGAL